MSEYEAPTRYAETMLLENCAILAIDVTLRLHYDEYDRACQVLKKTNRKINGKGISTVGKLKAELVKISSEMANIERITCVLKASPVLMHLSVALCVSSHYV